MTPLEIIREFDNQQCVIYMTLELKKLGFEEYYDGCFKYGEFFKVVFSSEDGVKSLLPMQIIYSPIEDGKRGAERKYLQYMHLVSIAHIRQAYTILTGEPL